MNASKLSDVNITRVLVSPMERALQTAILMFADHKNLAKIKFIVAP
jgi:phosphohistidine phosphatase SixA